MPHGADLDTPFMSFFAAACHQRSASRLVRVHLHVRILGVLGHAEPCRGFGKRKVGSLLIRPKIRKRHANTNLLAYTGSAATTGARKERIGAALPKEPL